METDFMIDSDARQIGSPSASASNTPEECGAQCGQLAEECASSVEFKIVEIDTHDESSVSRCRSSGAAINVGSSSFIKAAIQALYACNEFRHTVLRFGGDPVERPLLYELAQLFGRIGSAVSHQTSAEPIDFGPFYARFAELSTFDTSVEPNVTSFFEFMVNRFRLELKQTFRTPFEDLLGGEFEIETLCWNRHRSRSWREPFTALRVDLPPASVGDQYWLQELIDINYKSRQLCERSLTNCLANNCGLETMKYWSVARTPPILVVYVLRFVTHAENGRMKERRAVRIDQTLAVNGERFALFAMINHSYIPSGESLYVTYVRRGDNWTVADTVDGEAMEMLPTSADTGDRSYVMFFRKLLSN